MPSEWTTFRLGDACMKIGSGATPRGGSGVYLESGPVALIRSQNIYNEGFRREGLVFITSEHAAQLENVEVLPGDVLLNITGDSVARCCHVDPSILPARVNQHVAIVRPVPSKLDPHFLRYYLVSPEVQSRMLSWAGSGGTRNALTKGMIESFEIVAPMEIDEQRAIAHILGTLDDKIELNRRMNETLEAIARSTFKSWFVDFEPVRAKAGGHELALSKYLADLFPRSFGESELGEIPQSWRVGRLDEVLMFQRGFDLPSSKRTPGPYPVIAASGPSGTHNQFMVRGPGVATGRSGVLGTVYYIHQDFWPLNTSLWVKEFKASTPAYAFYLLQRMDFALFNAGSAVPTLNRNHIHSLPTLMPPMNVIQAFESAAVALLKRQKANEDECHTLASIRKTLLPKLVSGEIRVKKAEKFVEHAV